MTAVYRHRGRWDSLVLLIATLLVATLPMVAHYNQQCTRAAAALTSVLLGSPLLLWALWQLGRGYALMLSGDRMTLHIVRGTFFSRTARDVPISEVRIVTLADYLLYIGLSSGEHLSLDAHNTAKHDAALRAFCEEAGLPYKRTTVPAVTPWDGSGSD